MFLSVICLWMTKLPISSNRLLPKFREAKTCFIRPPFCARPKGRVSFLRTYCCLSNLHLPDPIISTATIFSILCAVSHADAARERQVCHPRSLAGQHAAPPMQEWIARRRLHQGSPKKYGRNRG